MNLSDLDDEDSNAVDLRVSPSKLTSFLGLPRSSSPGSNVQVRAPYGKRAGSTSSPMHSTYSHRSHNHRRRATSPVPSQRRVDVDGSTSNIFTTSAADGFSSSDTPIEDGPLRINVTNRPAMPTTTHSRQSARGMRSATLGGPSTPLALAPPDTGWEDSVSGGSSAGLGDGEDAATQNRRHRALSHPSRLGSSRDLNAVDAPLQNGVRHLTRPESASAPSPETQSPGRKTQALPSTPRILEPPRPARPDIAKARDVDFSMRRSRTVSLERSDGGQQIAKRRSRDPDKRPLRTSAIGTSGSATASRRHTPAHGAKARPISDVLLPSSSTLTGSGNLASSYDGISVVPDVSSSQASLRDLLSQVDIAGALQLVNTVHKQQQMASTALPSPLRPHASSTASAGAGGQRAALSISSELASMSSLASGSAVRFGSPSSRALFDQSPDEAALAKEESRNKRKPTGFSIGNMSKKAKQKLQAKENERKIEHATSELNERGMRSTTERQMEGTSRTVLILWATF